jgi:hypothetical protein
MPIEKRASFERIGDGRVCKKVDRPQRLQSAEDLRGLTAAIFSHMSGRMRGAVKG